MPVCSRRGRAARAWRAQPAHAARAAALPAVDPIPRRARGRAAAAAGRDPDGAVARRRALRPWRRLARRRAVQPGDPAAAPPPRRAAARVKGARAVPAGRVRAGVCEREGGGEREREGGKVGGAIDFQVGVVALAALPSLSPHTPRHCSGSSTRPHANAMPSRMKGRKMPISPMMAAGSLSGLLPSRSALVCQSGGVWGWWGGWAGCGRGSDAFSRSPAALVPLSTLPPRSPPHRAHCSGSCSRVSVLGGGLGPSSASGERKRVGWGARAIAARHAAPI